MKDQVIYLYMVKTGTGKTLSIQYVMRELTKKAKELMLKLVLNILIVNLEKWQIQNIEFWLL
jgi:Cdc6-like AAA superfamily ATPase